MKKAGDFQVALLKNKPQMKVDHRLEPAERIGDLFERLHDVGFGEVQTVIENRVQQALFARDVMVKPGLGESGRSSDVTHGGIVVTLSMKHFGGNLKHPIPGELAITVVSF